MSGSESVSADRGPESRRGFLKRSAAAAPLALGVAATAQAAGPKSTAPVSPYGLPFADPYTGWVALRMQEIKNDENYHLQTLLQTLGTNARPKPTFQNITPATALEVIQLGAMSCNTGAGAYLFSGQYLQNPALILTGSSFGQVEAFQSGWLNSVINQSLVVNALPFSPPLSIEDVMVRIAPFLVNLNGGPPATFDTTTKSPENDIAILNFALILEYLENDLYNYGVPKFFS